MTSGDAHGVEDRAREEARRLSALESEMALLRSELEALRALVSDGRAAAPAAPDGPARSAASSSPRLDPAMVAALRRSTGSTAPAASPGTAPRPAASALSGAELESLVGRYGTLALGALVFLFGVGTLIVWAVKSGLLTPQVRVAMGALAAACVAGAGLQFRRRGDLRYGNVLLALALAIVDLVAWGAGPRLGVIPTGAALLIVDLAAVGVAWLAVRDESEFLFGVAVLGALSAPFVTSSGQARVATLLAYGAVVLLGAMRAARDPSWRRTGAMLLAGAAAYVLAAVALPVGPEWHGAYLIPLFVGGLAVGAMVVGPEEWRGHLSRGFLGVGMLGVATGWDRVAGQPGRRTALVAVSLAAVTHAALWIRRRPQRLWTVSALLLPMLSLGVAAAGAPGGTARSAVLALWGAFGIAAWGAERYRQERERAGAHLLSGGILVAMGIAVWLWASPFLVVAGLAAWGVALAWLSHDESSPLAFLGISLVLGCAAVSALDQLASLHPYAYLPFATRSSGSAFVALLGMVVGGAVLARGSGAGSRSVPRDMRLGAPIGFAFLWGRMELVHAFSLDLGTFLLTLYYAAVGVGSIVAGRRWGLTALRLGGLGLAIYAAVKAVVEASQIGGLLLRVGCYVAVGVFLLGAGYLYRDAGTGERPEGLAQ